jgi:hypothetical protein
LVFFLIPHSKNSLIRWPNRGYRKIPSFHPPVNFDRPHRAEHMEHSIRMFCQTLQLEDPFELR